MKSEKIGIIGYGPIGKQFRSQYLNHHPKNRLVIRDKIKSGKHLAMSFVDCDIVFICSSLESEDDFENLYSQIKLLHSHNWDRIIVVCGILIPGFTNFIKSESDIDIVYMPYCGPSDGSIGADNDLSFFDVLEFLKPEYKFTNWDVIDLELNTVLQQAKIEHDYELNNEFVHLAKSLNKQIHAQSKPPLNSVKQHLQVIRSCRSAQ